MISEKTLARYDRIALRAHKAGFKAAKAKARQIVRENDAETIITRTPGKTYAHRVIGLPCGFCHLSFASGRIGFFQYLKAYAHAYTSPYYGARAHFDSITHRLGIKDEPVHPKHRYLTQSLRVNEAYYEAVVSVLNKAGIDCSFGSTID